jgi:hypothetical protein
MPPSSDTPQATQAMAAIGSIPATVFMPANLAIYLVRHAEKPDVGPDLSQPGQARAKAYVTYFQNLKDLSGKAISWKFLFASADSADSDRPILTIEPFSQAVNLPLDYQYKDKDYSKLVDKIRDNKDQKFSNSSILICWHHGELLNLAAALGASSSTLPSSSNWPAKWPKGVYGWLLKIYFKADGSIDLQNTQATNQNLMPEDTVNPVFGK